MSELIEFWIKVSLFGVGLALICGTIAALWDALRKRNK